MIELIIWILAFLSVLVLSGYLFQKLTAEIRIEKEKLDKQDANIKYQLHVLELKRYRFSREIQCY